ncbi:MAG: hypothetical protein DRR19_03060 [Candidatus Parabeggiatoa sp. nov. 1]|nr:MAG: hypothetical protein DRR19_03060 [Gammaproteobacteria bacterium]
MTYNIDKLLDKLAVVEANLPSTRLLAPCVQGGRVRVKIAGLVYTFIPRPNNFTGWGIFQPIDEKHARLVEPASLPQIAEYLQRLPTLRLYLVEKLKAQTWFGFPVNTADAMQRFKIHSVVPIHLVSEGDIFETVIVRTDGKTWWFDSLDRRADLILVQKLKEALIAVTMPDDLKISKLTPELRAAYQLASQQAAGFESYFQKQQSDTQVLCSNQYAERRLRSALTMGGGELRAFQDRGDYWLVEWTTNTQENHTSAIAKRDLTVISAGICLDERDRDFDLQSLVGVIEGKGWDDY